ncbi:MAG: ATP-dependent DNA helicase RecG [Treponema sp.]|nr:ATP-dependent DNA helicase RecG [Treponema sp.]
MLLRSITAPLTSIKGIGPEMASNFARLGITNVAGLLSHYPRDWEDRSVRVPISEFHRAKVRTEVTVLSRDWIGGKSKSILKVYVEDESGRAALVCFNRPWLAKQLVPGERFRLWGSFSYKYRDIQSTTFEIEPVTEKDSGSNPRPIYPLCAGLTKEKLHRFVGRAIEKYAGDIEDELPKGLISRDALLSKAAAIKAIHFPDSMADLEAARKTLIYEELFYLEIMVGMRAMSRKGRSLPERLDKQASFSPLQERLIGRLPFQLTQGQRGAIDEISADIVQGGFSMSRLLQGDVGSGKTLVSFLAALRAVDHGAQAVLMAPTELLARQHAESAARLLEPLGLRIAYLTGNIKAAGRKELLRHLAAGEIDIAVGTHALFSRDVAYKNLKLVVVDEQHRFGVMQRSLIMEKGDNPHLLMMSSTPIPRTLAMTVFGDMDVSVIRDLPPGRKPIKTHLAKESSEARVYDFVRRRLEAGSQAYFVYPLIEAESDDETDSKNSKDTVLKDVVSMAERLAKEVFPNFSVALVHSRLDDEEKRKTMERFRAGEIKILVATSVVEVGVDVPNANCMVIEHAERFGLSALHQLRGRVGRGQDQAFCFLVYSDGLTDDGKARLKVMLESTDGFVIAEEDLRLRGPGQIAGIEQSGYLNLGIANPIRDIDVLAKARADAFFILENDPGFVLEDHQIVARVLDEAPPFSSVML